MSRSGGYKCYNIRCLRCIGTLCSEPGDVALSCADRIVSRKTNADRIRAMSDEELLEFLKKSVANAYMCKLMRTEPMFLTIEWLRQPAEED